MHVDGKHKTVIQLLAVREAQAGVLITSIQTAAKWVHMGQENVHDQASHV